MPQDAQAAQLLQPVVVAAIISAAGVFIAAVIGQMLGAVLGTRAAADINARASERIAQHNAQNAREIERIKADGQIQLERERENRQWRRELARPLLDRLIERQRLWAEAGSSTQDVQKWEELVDQLDALGQGSWAALVKLAPTALYHALSDLETVDRTALWNEREKIKWYKGGARQEEYPILSEDLSRFPSQDEAQRNAFRALQDFIDYGNVEREP